VYWEVTLVQPAPPAARQLAQRLRQLRQQQWPDARLTQDRLARAFSTEDNLAAATISSWESLSSPKLPPRHRLLAYARFFATPRSVKAEPELLPLEEFTPDEKSAYEKLEAELLNLRSAASGESSEEEIAFTRSWHFADNARLTIVCAELPPAQVGPLGDPSNPNYTELHAYADADALWELHGQIARENPLMTVYRRIPSEVEPDDLTGHVILLGGVVWNEITGRLSEMAQLPVRQVADAKLPSGEIFVAEVDGKERQFWPKWLDGDDGLLAEDVGLLARVRNPLNANRTLTICNGIHSRGVYGAVRTLTDASLRDANERYITANFGDSNPFAILMSVKVIKNRAMTPDFSTPGVVLYQWPRGIAA
jgi:hypothetical protein